MSAPFGNAGPDRDLVEQRLRAMAARLDAIEQRGLRNGGEISVFAPNGVKTFGVGPDTTTPPVTGAPWYTTLRDVAGGIILSGDVHGGIAEPWLPIPMYPLFAVAAGLYTSMSRAVDTTERTLWEGRIGYLSHPRLQIAGTWGPTSGTNTTRYKLKVNGVQIGTWDSAALTTDVRGPYDPTVGTGAALHSLNATITLTAQTLTGTGNYACQVLGCHQRQT
jgi:hypothetical protein